VSTDCLAAEILKRLEAAGSPERREVAKSYFPTAMKVLGVAVPDIRPVVRDVNRCLKTALPEEVLSLVRAVLDGGTFEGRQAAYEILAKHMPAMAMLDTKAVEWLGNGIDNWASVDCFATMIAGPVWREGRVPDAAVEGWARSSDRWWRRTAVVSTVALNQKARGGTGDTARTLGICVMVVGDHDDMVAKGLSWALRELSKRDRQAVSDFIDRHEPVLAARVRREVRNKLRSGLKNPSGRV